MEQDNQKLSNQTLTQDLNQTTSEIPKEQSSPPIPDWKSEEATTQIAQLLFFQKNKNWIVAVIAILIVVVLGLGMYLGFVKQKQETLSSSLLIPGKSKITPSPTSIPALSISPTPTPNYGEIKCYENNKYFIVVGNGKTPGFLVKYKTTSDQQMECGWIVGDTDFVIGIEWAEYYLGLTGDFLLLDSGTGPGLRGLIIYDLSERKKVFTDSYESYPYQSAVTIQEDSLIYWTGANREVTPQNCPEVEGWRSGGLGAIIETKVKLNLSTLTKIELGEYQCMPEQ